MATVIAVAKPGTLRGRWSTAFDGRGAPHRLVAETTDLAEAERLIEQSPPDVIAFDTGAARADAIETCRRLAASGEEGARPVFAIAPRLDDDERSDLLGAGATGYVLSTIDAQALAIAVQAIAESAGRRVSEGGYDPGDWHAPDCSRADFLRWTGAAAAASFVIPGRASAETPAAAPSPSNGRELPMLPAASAGESDMLRMQRELVRSMRKPVAERRWVMVIDLRKCSGCNACTVGCIAENQLPPGVVYRPVLEQEVGTYPNVSRRFVPRPCMQCEAPPCTSVCPVGATWRREDGIIAVDYERCIGCRYCLTACPYSARTSDKGKFYTDDTPARQPYEEQASPEYDQGNVRADGGSPIGNARKCHFCLHRVEAGQLPACVTTCIGHATYFGDANDSESLVAELIGRPDAMRLKEELGTRPRVYYLT